MNDIINVTELEQALICILRARAIAKLSRMTASQRQNLDSKQLIQECLEEFFLSQGTTLAQVLQHE